MATTARPDAICRRLRRGGERLAPDLARHAEACADCGRYLERLEALRSALGRPRCEAVPDAGFAARVQARLTAAPAVQLGVAANRLLPFAAASVLVLLLLQLVPRAPAAGADAGSFARTTLSSGEELLLWVLETGASDGADGAPR
ncbi:MAG: hypothetical protein DWQ36_08130 [Acidobacteria bacterium]|nr:MAG: hypothetical protein DWQ30_01855 [Acidobacteriota bacterium]REK08776.1 MAG: hypothetical protein DWQ36_08130 [Acidobacteriota bacterium]